MNELAALLTALQVFDGWTTYHILKRGGGEKWPPMKWLMTQLERMLGRMKAVYWTLVLTKGGASALAWFLALVPIAHPSGEGIRLGLLLALAVGYGAVAVNNWRVFKDMEP